MQGTRNGTNVLAVLLLAAAAAAVGCRTLDSGAGVNAPGAGTGTAPWLEHVALNVADPGAMAEWYAAHLGMRIVRSGPPPADMRFIADAGGRMMLELYHNPPDAVPDYASMDPLLLHVAFMVDDVAAVRTALIAAGATPVGEVTVTPAGDRLAMLRDPWGLAIQFVRRAEPMLAVRGAAGE